MPGEMAFNCAIGNLLNDKKTQDDLWQTDGIFIGNLVHSETQMD